MAGGPIGGGGDGSVLDGGSGRGIGGRINSLDLLCNLDMVKYPGSDVLGDSNNNLRCVVM